MFLITSDIHCTDKPRDSYRFGLFPWLAEQQSKYETQAVFILGDLTDAKDRHSSKLVNSLIGGLKLLKPPVYILKGNHDFVDPDNPFFRFLDEIPGLTFCCDDMNMGGVTMIPHQPDQASLDAAFKRVPVGGLIFMHQTITGAISETGAALSGLSLPPNKAAAIYSGDIHTPQTITTDNGDVTYIGAPYNIRFGDTYEPRVLLVGKEQVDLHFRAPRKYAVTLRDLKPLSGFKKGDQVKITMELTRAELVEWTNIKRNILDHCKALELEVYGLEIKAPPPEHGKIKSQGSKTKLGYFTALCNNENLPNVVREAGARLIGGENG